jgi:trk system potassium uptake protein TrkH
MTKRYRFRFNPEARPWHVFLPAKALSAQWWSPSLVLASGFAGLIVLGTALLALPFASRAGESAGFITSLFTATSAVCVTGLVVVDTHDFWAPFGQAVIIILVQLGGFGLMTGATLLLLAFRHRVGVRERQVIGESVGLNRLGGLVTLMKRIAVFMIVTEALGMLALYFVLSPGLPADTAVWRAAFYAVSGFNNAGFDLEGGFRSLAGYAGDQGMLLTISALVILGGLSFLVFIDLWHQRSFRGLTLDSKLILVMTGSLLLGGTLIFLLMEYQNTATLGPLDIPLKLLNAFFLSMTARTAGFATISIGALADYSHLVLMILMFIGGASGSTSGGIKVGTFALIMAVVASTVRGRSHPTLYGRELVPEQVGRALALVALATGVIALSVLALSITEELPFVPLLFESFSAFGTVGLSTGITPSLSPAGQIIIVLTMFIGRLGTLGLVFAMVIRHHEPAFRLPEEPIRIG